MGSLNDASPGRGRRRKVARLIDEYNLQGIGEELERLWTADDDRRSLRSLADLFNRRLLKISLEEAGVTSLDGEVENAYRLLDDDDVSGADRTRARRRLEREGVDVDTLQEDFVTYQAVRTYLKNYRGAEYNPRRDGPAGTGGDEPPAVARPRRLRHGGETRTTPGNGRFDAR